MDKEIKKFIGKKVIYDPSAGLIYCGDEHNVEKIIPDVAGHKYIKELFKNKDGTINFADAEKFQDTLGEWIADALNNKLKQ